MKKFNPITQEAGKSKEEILERHIKRYAGLGGRMYNNEDVLADMEEYAQQREQPWVRVEPTEPTGLPEYGERVFLYGIFSMNGGEGKHEVYIGALFDNGRFYSNAVQLFNVTHFKRIALPKD